MRKVFNVLRNLNRHVRTIHEKTSTSFSCTECDYSTSRQDNLQKHIRKRHNDIPTAHNIPPKIARHEPIPNIIKPIENDEFLSDIEQQEMQDMFEPNTQVGFGITQVTPADENISQELRQFFRDEQPWGTDRNLRQVYVRNFHRIRDSETNHRRSRTPLRYLRHDRAPLIETIAQALENIFRRQSNAFKINLSFSFILQHRETGEFRYFYASNNQQILKSPKLIRNQPDLDNLLDFLASQDFPSHLKDQRPNTKWVTERICQSSYSSCYVHIPTWKSIQTPRLHQV